LKGFSGFTRGLAVSVLDKFASPIGASECPRQYFGFFILVGFLLRLCRKALARWERLG